MKYKIIPLMRQAPPKVFRKLHHNNSKAPKTDNIRAPMGVERKQITKFESGIPNIRIS
jgi:hypothetical protein